MAGAVCLFSIALCGLDYVNQGVHQGIQEFVGYTTESSNNGGNNIIKEGQNWLNGLYYGRTTTQAPTANFPSRGSGSSYNDVPISPCPDIFYYELNGNEWTGIVSLQNLENAEFIKLNLQMSIRAKLTNVSNIHCLTKFLCTQ